MDVVDTKSATSISTQTTLTFSNKQIRLPLESFLQVFGFGSRDDLDQLERVSQQFRLITQLRFPEHPYRILHQLLIKNPQKPTPGIVQQPISCTFARNAEVQKFTFNDFLKHFKDMNMVRFQQVTLVLVDADQSFFDQFIRTFQQLKHLFQGQSVFVNFSSFGSITITREHYDALFSDLLAGCHHLHIIDSMRYHVPEEDAIIPFQYASIRECFSLKISCFPIHLTANEVLDYLHEPRFHGEVLVNKQLSLSLFGSNIIGDQTLTDFMSVLKEKFVEATRPMPYVFHVFNKEDNGADEHFFDSFATLENDVTKESLSVRNSTQQDGMAIIRRLTIVEMGAVVS